MSVAAIQRQSTHARLSLADARPVPFWLDGPGAPEVHSTLVGDESCDLTVVGGGFTGLWTALLAKERDPDRDVVLLERESSPSGASGRNGGFMLGAFVDYFQLPLYGAQMQPMFDLACHNRAEIEAALDRHGIDCDLEANGWVMTALRDWHLDRLKDIKASGDAVGLRSIPWNQLQTREALDSPKFLGAVFQPDAIAIVHPGKLAWGLKRACERAGVRFFEFSPATALDQTPGGMRVVTPLGSVRSGQVALATYAHRSLIPSLRWWRVPMYSHVLASEPLTDAQMASIGWSGRQGFIDLDPFLYYYRPTRDNRIIWGHVDATLHWKRGMQAEFEQDFPVFDRMAGEFFDRFPQLEGINFTHRWGGALDVTSRQAPFFGTVKGGRVAYANGYMAGVGASHAGAEIMLDMLAGESSIYTRLPLVSGRGIHGRPSLRPYPPEPLMTLGMKLARAAVREEEQSGQRHWLLKGLARLGFIF
jgi:glycine/D-amino acid oxidase-like deaminating enzyme